MSTSCKRKVEKQINAWHEKNDAQQIKELSLIATMSVEEDCPICLNDMHPYDHKHPTQCENRCGYNFCETCILSLIAASNDDYAEASDGSFHVKVFLSCPNCRSDLSFTIRDTLLLRKKAKIAPLSYDSELSPSQLRLKSDLEHPRVQEAIHEAELHEALYLGNDPPLELIKYEEMGVEVDLEEGIDHQSLLQSYSRSEAPAEVEIDPTLFADLYYFLSENERVLVTELMTSGIPSQLADAAEIVYSVRETRKHLQLQEDEEIAPPLCRSNHASFFHLIAESREALDKKTRGTTASKAPSKRMNVSGSQSRRLHREVKTSRKFRKLFPLPNRMPKHVEIDIDDALNFVFVDNDWDDTIVEGNSNMFDMSNNSLDSVCNMPFQEVTLSLLWNFASEQEEMKEPTEFVPIPQENSVVLLETGKHTGSHGASNGDVITHIDGDSVEDMSAFELLALLRGIKQEPENVSKTKVTMTFNAERSVAEALKRRSVAIAESCRF